MVIVSSQVTVENLEFNIPIPDFTAGETVTTSFSFDYPDLSETHQHQVENSLLIIVINISSNNSDFPVWKNDFELNGSMVVKKGVFIEKEYELECHVDDFIIDYPFGHAKIEDIPEGSFFCTNEELLAMSLGSDNGVTLHIKSNPALWPGKYNFSIGLFYPEENMQFDLTVRSPEEEIYGTRSIPFEIMTVKNVASIDYKDWSDKRPRWRRLCRNCNEYGIFRNRARSFKEGNHDITIRAVDYFGNIKEKDISFFIDSRKPRIYRATPRRNTFADGNFEVQFREDHPAELILYYGDDEHELNIEEDCYEERRKYYCTADVDVDEYDGQEIEYWFEIKDIAGNKDTSRPTTINVDATPPILNNPDDFWTRGTGRYSNYIYFDLNITESNFDEAVLTYEYERRGKIYEREKRLCSRLKYGICEKKFRIRNSYDNFDLIIKDDAGNEFEVNDILFEV